MMDDFADTAPGIRGRAETIKRDQIVAAAKEHFSLYGYSKTTVSDLAKAIGYSKGYIYKFFDSKQAIGEAICASCLGQVLASVTDLVAQGTSATDRFRRFFRGIVDKSAELFFADRKLYEIASVSATEHWASGEAYLKSAEEMLRAIILEGRQSGEFERKTPIDETCRGIMQVMQPFMNPVMLEYNLDRLPDAQIELSSLVLRSLAP